MRSCQAWELLVTFLTSAFVSLFACAGVTLQELMSCQAWELLALRQMSSVLRQCNMVPKGHALQPYERISPDTPW
jgi:hypothetical protein